MRLILLVGACAWLTIAAGASSPPPAGVPAIPAPPGPIVDLDFANISGSTVPDASGYASDGGGLAGPVGSESVWNPPMTTDSLGQPSVAFDGTQDERIEIPDVAGRLDVNHFSILVQFTLDESVDTDPAHQRYELMEQAGSFWFNVREDTTPRYLLRVGGFFDGAPNDSFTGTHPIPDNTLTWAIATYDGARLTTYIADGDGLGLTLDNSIPQTGTLDPGTTITGIDENLVVGAKHRLGHGPGGSGTDEDAEAFFNGTMSRFLVYDTALTPQQIAAVIAGPGSGDRPGPVQAQFVPRSVVGKGPDPTVRYRTSWAPGTCPAGSTYDVALRTGAAATTPSSGTATAVTVGLPIDAASTVAVDCGGGDSSVAGFTATGYSEAEAAYTGTWIATSSPGDWGGSAESTTANSASATFQCSSCQALAWVTDEGPARGAARVYVDGALAATVETRSPTTRNRVVAYSFAWPADGAHTLRIVNLATGGHPAITVDGFLTQS